MNDDELQAVAERAAASVHAQYQQLKAQLPTDDPLLTINPKEPLEPGLDAEAACRGQLVLLHRERVYAVNTAGDAVRARMLPGRVVVERFCERERVDRRELITPFPDLN